MTPSRMPKLVAALAVTTVIATISGHATRALADALVVTRAARATTVAEVFVESDGVRVELEIGTRDVPAFATTLGVEGGDPEVTPFHFRADDEELPFEIVEVRYRRRVRRDEVTGEPLPERAEDEQVVFAVLRARPPESVPELTLAPPVDRSGRVASDIGFVLYHSGVAVNDFRYLAQTETIDLDWEDPWYSRFRNRNLRRQYDAPLSVFLYVEPFEVRKEVVVRPRDLQRWVDLGLEGRQSIRPEDYDRIFERAGPFLAEHGRLSIDGRPAPAKLDQIHFVRRTLRQAAMVDPPEELNLDTATLGAVYVAVVERLPDVASVEWDLFPPKSPSLPCATVDEAGALPAMITREDPVLEWRNHLVDPSVPTMLELAPPPARSRLPVPWGGLTVVAVGLLAAARWRSRAGWIAVSSSTIGIGLALLGLGWVNLPHPFRARPTVDGDEAAALVDGLLRNLYTATARRDEEVVYDRLALSVTGDLLKEVYLQQRRTQGAGRARVRVTKVVLDRCSSTPLADRIGFEADCRWSVRGDVSHWGHTHTRTNVYEADVRVESVGDRWRISGFTLNGAQRDR